MQQQDDKVEFLSKLKIFTPLSYEELVGLADVVRAYEFKTGSVIAYQRDIVEHFYMVKEGTVESFVVNESGVVVDSKRYSPGREGYFKDIWLFKEKDHKSTVRAASDGVLYTIDRGDFSRFLDRYPEVELEMPDEVWAELDDVVMDEEDASFRSTIELLPDEVIEYESRRTGLLLAWYLLPPAILLLLLPVGITFLRVTGLGFALVPWGLLLAAALALPIFLYGLYRYLDWANDHLIITSKQLVHTEFDLGTISGTVLKIPLDQIQSINVETPSFIESILGVGTVRVGTASQAQGLMFDNIGTPKDVEETLTRIRNRAKELDDGRTRAAVREALEDYFKVPDQVERVEGDTAPQATSQSRQRNGKVKRRGNRVEEGDTITYGRHWIVLFQLIWWVVGLILLTVIGLGAALIFVEPFRTSVITYIVAGVAFLIEAGLLFYYYEDWANDVFQVTRETVIDIDRGPLGFVESQKTAPLENVQNVQADRPNFWATVFGYGNVMIETAGASADMSFENVANPNQVQADIFARREQIRASKARGAARERQREFTLMIDEYQQLREQQKIPDRTPHVDLRADDVDNSA